MSQTEARTVERPAGQSEAAERPLIVLDFGAQYAQLIARRIRELRVFSEILPHDTPVDELRRRNPLGIVLSGGPASIHEPGAPVLDPRDPRARRSRARHLLRHAGDGTGARRRGRPNRHRRVRQDDARRRRRRALRGPRRHVDLLDEPQRRGDARPRRLHGHRVDADHADRGDGVVPRAGSTPCSSIPRCSTRRAAASCSTTSSRTPAGARAPGRPPR